MLKNKKNRKKNTAFTLVELLVSITLFSFVITAALGALYTIIKANEKAKIIKLVTNNLNVALEGMSRELRVGHDYNCYSDQCHKLSFKTKEDCDGYYEFKDNTIYKNIETKDSSGNCQEIGTMRIVGTNIKIDDLTFRTIGLDKDDDLQPRILMTLKGSISGHGLIKEEKFDIQSTISQRAQE